LLIRIAGNDEGWEESVPQKVAELIKNKHMFGLPYQVPEDVEEEDYINEEETDA